MPRLRQNAERDAMKDLVGEISAQSARYGYRSQTSLSKALGVCQATVSNYLKQPEYIPMGILRSIVKVLRPNPIIVLKALGYSSSDIRKLRSAAAVTDSSFAFEAMDQ